MAPKFFLLLALLLGAADSRDASASRSRLAADLEGLDTRADLEFQERPIMRVVHLLTDIKGELELEAANDQELYDKLVCWCETNDKEKTKAVADGNTAIEELSAKAEENKALASTRKVEIEALTNEVAKLTEALSDADALRTKEKAEFNEQEKDYIESIQSLGSALNTLGKVQGGSLIQQQAALLQAQKVMLARPSMTMAAVAPHQRAQVSAIMHSTPAQISLLQSSDTKGKVQAPEYAPASGMIFGILQQMKEHFETSMETGKKEEAQAVADFQALKSTKSDQVKASNNKIYEYTEEMAKAKETTANSKESIEDVTETVYADTEFLAKLKTQCADIDNQWAARSKVRAEEIKAVGETISILTEDDARDTMSNAGTFMQRFAQSKRETKRREATVAFLANAGKNLHSPRLSYLATRMQSDVFGKMKESIDGMVGVLGEEQQAEIGKKDGCVGDFNTNEKQTTERQSHFADVETEINVLQADIDFRNQDEAALAAKIAEAQAEMKKASENREGENKEFQTVIADQRETQAILEKAKVRMEEFYKAKAAAASLLQRSGHTVRRQQPPVAFGDYNKSSGANGILVLLDSIIQSSKETEAGAVKGEAEAQAAYEAYVKGTNDSIKSMNSQITTDEEIEAQEVKKEVVDESDKRATGTDILKLGQVDGSLHQACDFTVDHFDERQTKRADEMEALKQSKAIFSGMQ